MHVQLVIFPNKLRLVDSLCHGLFCDHDYMTVHYASLIKWQHYQ